MTEPLRDVQVSLARLETLLTQSIERQGEVNAHLHKLCSRHAHWIEGNGTEGAKVRMDRLEQASRSRQWWGRAAGIAVLAPLLDFIWRHFGNGGS